MGAAKALARLHKSAGSSEPWLLADALTLFLFSQDLSSVPLAANVLR